MPTHTGKDAKGCFCQWGGHGKKYYYTCGDDAARGRATKKANAQGQAVHAAGYVGNQQSGANKMFQYIVTNLKPVVRHDSMENRDWLVGPVQMITEGVHNGSDGPIFYPAAELAKMTAVWNHKPVVVYHPQRNGVGVSACDPVELTTRKIGVLMKTTFNDESKKLGAEAWLDPSRLRIVDNRVAEAIEKNEVMEVSTGLFMDLERTEGEWNGEKYIGVARNIQPDHLAVLPDLKGACSIADGAGLLRMNQAGDDLIVIENGVDVTEKYIRMRQKAPGSFVEGSFKTIWLNKSKGIKAVIGKLKGDDSTTVQSYLFNKDKWDADKAKAWVSKHKGVTNISTIIMNEISYDSVQTLLRGALITKEDNAWITDVFDTYFIYEKDGKLYRQSYKIDDGQVQFEGLPVSVERQVTYKEITLSANKESPILKGQKMDKQKIVDELIANEKTSWTEEHRSVLMALDETVLTNMHVDIVELTKPPVASKPEDKPNPTAPVANTQPIVTPKAVTEEEYINNAPPSLREGMLEAKRTAEEVRKTLIETITANKRNIFTKEYLATKTVEDLRGMANLATTENESPRTIPIFLGQNGAAVDNTPVEPLALPTMNFDKKAS